LTGSKHLSLWVLIILSKTVSAQLIGLNVGFSNHHNLRISDLNFPVGIDLRVELRNDALICSFQRFKGGVITDANLTYFNPQSNLCGASYRKEDYIQIGKTLLTQTIDFGLQFHWLRIHESLIDLNINTSILPAASIGYGVLSRAKTIGLQYKFGALIPRRYELNTNGLVTTGISSVIYHQLSLLIYPKVNFTRKQKPTEQRRRNRT